jgi:hypothetical protein
MKSFNSSRCHNALMRTNIELPDSLPRQLKSRAALEGTTLKALVLSLMERGLNAPPATPGSAERSPPPSIATGRPLPLRNPSNASLFELLDDA